MSLVRGSLTWLRQTFGWLDDPRSWAELVFLIVLLQAAAGLLIFGRAWPVWLQVVLWGMLIALPLALEKIGWLKLFGPVLFYDMVRTARRSRYVIMRTLILGLLVAVLFLVWFTFYVERHLDDRQRASRLAETYFEWYTIVQLVVVTLLTPAYVAGAVSEEKDRKTLEFLLATDLHNREIILSKFCSRVANLLLIIMAGLPILSALQFLGGIDPNLVLMGFAVSALSVLGLGSVSILHSVLSKRPIDSIFLTYLFIFAYFALATFLWGLQQAGAWGQLTLWTWMTAPFTAQPVPVGEVLDPLTSVLNAGNPLIVIMQIGRAGMSGTLAVTLPQLLWEYALFHVTLSALCIGWSIFRVRAAALKQSLGRVKERHWDRPPIGEQPMLWKELQVEGGIRLHWLAWIVLIILVLLTVGTGLWIIAYYVWPYLVGGRHDNWTSLGEAMNAWVRFSGTSVGCLTILWAAVAGALSLIKERDNQTFDALITTPLSSDTILFAKFLGSLGSARMGLVWFSTILLLALFTGGLNVLAFPLVLGAWLIYASFFAMIGLWFSMVARSKLVATCATIGTTLLLSVGHWLVWMCCGPLLIVLDHRGRGPEKLFEYVAKFQAGNTPPFVLGWLMYSTESIDRQFGPPREFVELTGFSLVGLMLWGSGCVVLWFGLLAPRFRHLTRRDSQ